MKVHSTLFVLYYDIRTILGYLNEIRKIQYSYDILIFKRYLYDITIFVQYYDIHTILRYLYIYTILADPEKRCFAK